MKTHHKYLKYVPCIILFVSPHYLTVTVEKVFVHTCIFMNMLYHFIKNKELFLTI